MKSKQTGQDPKVVNYVGQGLALGLIFGTGIGTALSAATDNPGLLAIGIGAGMTLGIGIGTSLQRRHEEAQSPGAEPDVEDSSDQRASSDEER
jgi:hypothetical protein